MCMLCEMLVTVVNFLLRPASNETKKEKKKNEKFKKVQFYFK